MSEVLKICGFQVSQVYETIKFERLAELAPFSDAFRLERVIVDAAKNLELQVGRLEITL